MSDYGYRPDPPPEEGRPQGRASGQGRAYGSASGGGSREPDYGWGGGAQQGRRPGPQQPGSGSQPQGGGRGSASVGGARPQYGTPPAGQAPVGRGSASVGGARPTGSASVGGSGSGRASVGSASVGGGAGRASVGSASVGSASVGSASVGSARPINLNDADERTGRAGVGGRRRAGNGPLGKDDAEGPKKKRKRLGRKMLAALIAMGIIFVASVTVIATYFFQNTPPIKDVFRQGESSAFLSADGVQVGAFGDTLRLQADPEEMPDTVKDALVALEDRKFWDHGGVDYIRTMGALVNNLTGGETQGASTITQQYAGMYMDAREDISYDRKAREAALAIKMESEYSKEEIIGAYLNMAYFGRGAYGIEAAAKNYFNVPLADLDYDQAAFIVMQVKSPNGYYDPYYEDEYNEEASVGRWNFTMNAMVETGALTQSERDGYEYPTPIDTFNASGSWGGNTDYGFIVNERDGYVFDELLTRYGITKDMLKGNTEDNTGGGYTVELTIDSQIQAALKTTGSRGQLAVKTDADGNMLNENDEIVTNRDEAALDKNDEGYVYFEDTNEEATLAEYEDYMTTAMVAIDPDTGEVLGWYGGDNGFGVDKAGDESPHPPSSTFKLITAATAIENGDSIDSWFNASSPRPFDTLKNDDTETCIGGGEYPNCTLRNGGQESKIELTLTDSLRQSKNTPMYAISQKYGSDAILSYADAMGLDMMTQTRQVYDDDDKAHDVVVGYKFHDNGTYTQYGQALDGEGNWVTDEFGNIALETPLLLDDNCNPVVNLDGVFLADTDGEADACEIGGRSTTDPFYHHLAFGQYPTSVADMASMYATIANDGEHWPTHFVKEVRDNEGNVVEPVEELESKQVIDVETARDLQWVGSEIGGESEVDQLSRDYFGKTGTWEATCEDCETGWNAHAWYVGAIPQLSIAAWVGNATSESDPIAGPDGNKDGVFGSNTAYPVWFDAMNRILDAKEGDERWDEEIEWEGKANKGSASTWDIEDAGGPLEGGAFCAAKPEDPLCAGQVDEQAQEDCEADGGTWDGETCQPGEDEDEGGEETSQEPTGEESTDEECTGMPWDPPSCDDETSAEPSEESSESPGGNNQDDN
ncbi:transglycosylase domain-containing protein [Glycomyces albidus]|uniref:transglycosylase domain-containing protein n=1 Tax=Glycomyces albidus TaxID=2656774 RepID=UPI0012904264|nr:transglycosylase domain-containing protein [Glycomyces albidus]